MLGWMDLISTDTAKTREQGYQDITSSTGARKKRRWLKRQQQILQQNFSVESMNDEDSSDES
jgi:hypothetical protein